MMTRSLRLQPNRNEAGTDLPKYGDYILDREVTAKSPLRSLPWSAARITEPTHLHVPHQPHSNTHTR